ncbi:hypothetical protein BpHYR1_015627 [Brachionus plicatilis]|uniref:Uncharacterized protein n=1 Tax=Brachionus plicatilis TaxID=10195 RepID=A0A3M7RH73_BRAPC|nr:hypothetical protein BpHYR1_015627 [Brachionus plicatilis]
MYIKKGRDDFKNSIIISSTSTSILSSFSKSIIFFLQKTSKKLWPLLAKDKREKNGKTKEK